MELKSAIFRGTTFLIMLVSVICVCVSARADEVTISGSQDRETSYVPNAKGPGAAQCDHNGAFLFILQLGETSSNCLQGGPGVRGQTFAPRELVNSTGYRVWLHENADGSGWADCFDHGNAYRLSGRDQTAAQVEISNNRSTCGSTPGGKYCTVNSNLSWAGNASDGICVQSKGFHDIGGTVLTDITNATGYRIWLHQYSNGDGWDDCYSNNNEYNIAQTRDYHAQGIELTTNPNPC